MDNKNTNTQNELQRLRELYDQAYEKYTKRIDALISKRDYELGYIWNEICKLEKS